MKIELSVSYYKNKTYYKDIYMMSNMLRNAVSNVLAQFFQVSLIYFAFCQLYFKILKKNSCMVALESQLHKKDFVEH